MKLNDQNTSAIRPILEQLKPRLLFSGTHYVVTSLADVVADDGVVTLREALYAANANSAVTEDVLAGSDTETDLIMFNAAALAAEAGAGNPLTIVLGGSALTIRDDVNILGLGQDVLTIDANGRSMVMYLYGSGVEVLLSGLTLTGGSDYEGVYNLAELTMTGVTVSGNANGGIYNFNGELTLANVTVVGNGGTGISGTGPMTMTNVISSGNDGNGISASAPLELSYFKQFAVFNTHYASGDDDAVRLLSSTGDGTITFDFAGDTDDAGADMGPISISVDFASGSSYTVNQMVDLINVASNGLQTGYSAASLVFDSNANQYGVKLTANAVGLKSLTVGGTATLYSGRAWGTDANWDETTGDATGFNNYDNAATTLTNVTVSDNGGIGIENSGELTMTGGTISGNGEGGIYNDHGELTLMDVTVVGNGGTGISGSGTMTMTNVISSGNDGNGISASDTMILTNVTANNNTGNGISASETMGLTATKQFAYLDTHYASYSDTAYTLASSTGDGTITFDFAGDTDDAGAAMAAISISVDFDTNGPSYTVNQMVGLINAASNALQTGYSAASAVFNSDVNQVGIKLTANTVGIKTLTVAGTATAPSTGASWIADASWDETAGDATGSNNYDNAAATLINVTVSNNGGIGIYNSGELTLTGGTVSGNGDGGIANQYTGNLVINDGVITGNYAAGSGGGIYSDSDSTLEINTTIVALNGAGLDGDEIFGVWTGSGNQIGVDQVDMDVLIHDVLGTEYGDANLDLKVSLADLTIFSTNFGITEGATWLQGDFNGDGAVSLADMTILATNFGFDGTAAPAGSSEPITASLQAETEQATVALTEPDQTEEPVEPVVMQPVAPAETTSPADRPSAMAGYWQSQRSQRHNSQRPTLQLLSSRQQNQWLGDDSADDEVDLLMVHDLGIV